jgi:siroheme synthase
MAGTRVVFNTKAAEELLKSPEVRAMLRKRAEAVAARARETAPKASLDYRNGIGVEDATTDRAVVRVVARDWKSLIIESKTGNLVRALGAEGG